MPEQSAEQVRNSKQEEKSDNIHVFIVCRYAFRTQIKTAMAVIIVFLLMVLFQMVIGYSDYAINLLVRSPTEPTTRRYCVELAKLPNDHVVNITDFGWHVPYLTLPSVNACNTSDLVNIPRTFLSNTILILYEHQCKMTEQSWNVEKQFGQNISLMILTNRTNTRYELTYNTTDMPVSIPVLIFWQNDFNKMSTTYHNISNVEISISYPLNSPRKFRSATLLMFLLVLLILLSGNFWAADQFIRKTKDHNKNTQNESTSLEISPASNEFQDSKTYDNANQTTIPGANKNTTDTNKASENTDPAIIYLPYCIIALILCFAVGWLLLIYYFPKIMVYVLQGNNNDERMGTRSSNLILNIS